MARHRLAAFLSTLIIFGVIAPGTVHGGEEEQFLHRSADEAVELLIDTDMGLDDVRAIFALLADTLIDIHCIVTVEGSASTGKGLDNLIGLLESVHIENIPVYRGFRSPHLRPPPWRETANSMGGAQFPPPREIDPLAGTPTALNKALGESEGELHYLALGPLGNLARLENEHPGGLREIHTIWIPARIDNGEIEGWNLIYDGSSAEKVFAEAGRIVIIDLSPAREIDAFEILAAVEGQAEAARWIDKLLSNRHTVKAHLALHDELAAAALIDHDLLELDEAPYTIRKNSSGSYRIEPDSEGKIRLASLKHPRAAAELLKKLWQRPARRGHEHGNDHKTTLPAKTLLKAFHGHLGPYVVLGYRMGRLALESCGSEGHFGISAEVYSTLKIPKSCLIDGIQLGSGCTLGKGNIEVHRFDGPAYAIFRTEYGAETTIRLRPGIPALISRLIEEKGVEAAGEDLMDREPGRLFDLETAKRRHDN